METEDQKSEWGSADGRPDGNVIPFPGDWIGPREELIPIEASAPATDAGGLTEAPLGGDTFWSEKSDEIQSVLLAPEGPAPERRSPVPRNSRARRTPVLSFRPGGRSRVAATAAVVACGAALMLLLVLAERTRLHTPSVTAAVGPAVGGLQGDIASLAVSRPPGTKAASRSGRSHPPNHATRRGRSAAAPRAASRTLANTTLAASSQVAPHSASPPASTSSAETASASRPPAPVSGPVGEGAPFGPGSLG